MVQADSHEGLPWFVSFRTADASVEVMCIRGGHGCIVGPARHPRGCEHQGHDGM